MEFSVFELVLVEWLSAVLRWLHVVAAIGWIGSSFYFIHLDLSLKARPERPAGVAGDAWQVHGGGFYHILKYVVAPARMPDELTWFKWEAYATWLSGFALLVVVYYMQADLFLIDPAVMRLTAPQAAGLACLTLAVAWLAYEGLCRSPLGRHELALSLVGFVFLVAVTFGFTHVFSGRGALTQIGALIGTIMVANVFVVIIPHQKKTVAALIAGETPDPRWSAIGKQRSVHNNYLTLPVVFLMLSNHYPLVFATRWNWLMVAIVLAIGPVIRHFFNTRHAGKGSPWWTWGVAAAGVAAIVALSMAGPRGVDVDTGALPATPSFAEVGDVVISRCSMCHAKEPVWAGLAHAPKGVRLDEPDEIRRHARMIAVQAVHSSAMPPGNVTEMTGDERRLLAAWLAAGAPE
ncbi:putative membrane protein [Rhodovulum sp. PH10]|uniref:urate hydroxylase PuuD n=1 Tax=Rhodovulum sp. PH10 TaxID=1187851 RepID=UPI00027C2869|nr:urate hydroxylase PuuD [Rhodovulum sp. PH10]EJW13466.1 putative membrane protein [Rhodovulum sp. PH10]